MSPDAELVVLLAGLHALGFLFATLLFVVLMQSETASAWSPPDDDDDGEGNDRTPPAEPSGPRGGGVPLPDAVPARIRLREPASLGDLHERPPRRAPREPERRPQVPAADQRSPRSGGVAL